MKDSALKRRLLIIYNTVLTMKEDLGYWAEVRTRCRMNIMSSRKTLRYIRKHGCSVARFGDGEIAYAFGMQQYDIPFQASSDDLSQKLRNVIENKNDNVLICFPRYFNSLAGCTPKCRRGWWGWLKENQRQKKIVPAVRKLCGPERIFGDTQITRPYMDTGKIRRADIIFRELKQLWHNRDILIVEGTQTRLGVGNDLFSNVKSIRRILAPAVGAFEKYEQIKEAVLKNASGALILIALGPAATVLAADLADCDLQALDVGHVDIEYEWFLQRAVEKMAIKGKFTNEVIEGRNVEECNDDVYLSQVIWVVE